MRFWRVLETGWNLDVFWDLPLGPQDPGNMELEGKKFHPWGPATYSIKTNNYHIAGIQDCKLTNSYLQD